ncbi:MAG: hypothetical protein K0S70_845 [Microbacterium sp.]|jgi:GT2 family glycosyltransferase|nr:hypothetical protein [Microbacterium sp.]
MTAHPSPRVDIIIPVHGGWAFVEACIAAALSQTSRANVIVVDDASPDDTPERIAAAYPRVRLIRNSQNLGFARSCNVGIAAGESELVMLVNSDVELAENAVEMAVATFDAQGSRVGSASPLLGAPDGTVDSFGIVADVTGAGFVRFHGADRAATDPSRPRLLGPYGAVAVYRRAALAEVGAFDENIFMYGEELDLAYRLRAAGWLAVAIPHQLGVHLGGASAGRESHRQRYLSGFARGYTLRVYDVLRSRHTLRALATEALVCTARLFLRRDLASLRGRIDGWRRGKDVAKRELPRDGIDSSIGFAQSIRMREPGYWRSTSPHAQHTPPAGSPR